MRKLLAIGVLCLIGAAAVLAQSGAVASRRYAEKTPIQYTFGSFSYAATQYANADGYSTALESQVFPNNLIEWTNNFSSTGSFTTSTNSTLPTFTVSGNVGTITATGTSQMTAVDNQTSFAGPLTFVSEQIVQNAAVNSGNVVQVGICQDANNFIVAQHNTGSNAYINARIGGTSHTTALSSFAVPTAPWSLGFSLVGSSASFWYNSGSGWLSGGGVDVSAWFDPRTDGNLSTWHACFSVAFATATSWQISDLRTGLPGGVGIRDVSIVKYPDGRPYMQGSVAYFDATVPDARGVAYDGVFEYDVIAGTLTQIGAVLYDNGTTTYPAIASDMLYDSGGGTYWYLTGNWSEGITNANVTTYYWSFPKTTLDLLSAGMHIIPSSVTRTSLLLPAANTNNGYDAHLACSAWNYSASTCGKWLLAYTGKNQSGSGASTINPMAQYTTSDPSANSWTTIGDDTATTGYEGSRILRTATGSTGVQYWFGFGGILGVATRTLRIYNSSMSYVGTPTLTLPNPSSSTLNPPHPAMFSYGNNYYCLVFDDALFHTYGGSTQTNTMGSLYVATAPKY